MLLEATVSTASGGADGEDFLSADALFSSVGNGRLNVGGKQKVVSLFGDALEGGFSFVGELSSVVKSRVFVATGSKEAK